MKNSKQNRRKSLESKIEEDDLNYNILEKCGFLSLAPKSAFLGTITSCKITPQLKIIPKQKKNKNNGMFSPTKIFIVRASVPTSLLKINAYTRLLMCLKNTQTIYSSGKRSIFAVRYAGWYLHYNSAVPKKLYCPALFEHP